MKLTTAIVLAITTVTLPISGFFAYNSYKTSEASGYCATVQSQGQETVKADLTVQSARKMITMMQTCTGLLNEIPFKTAELKADIVDTESRARQLEAFLPMIALGQGMKQAFSQPASTVTPSPVAKPSIIETVEARAEAASNSPQIFPSVVPSSVATPIALATPLPVPTTPTQVYMGKAVTGESVFYVGVSGNTVTYQIGSDVVEAGLACDAGYLQNVTVDGTIVNAIMYPQSEAIRNVLISGCQTVGK